MPVRCWRGEIEADLLVQPISLEVTLRLEGMSIHNGSVPCSAKSPSKCTQTPLYIYIYIYIVIDIIHLSFITCYYVDSNLEAWPKLKHIISFKFFLQVHHFSCFRKYGVSLGSWWTLTTTATTGRNSLCGRPHGEADGTPRIVTFNRNLFEACIGSGIPFIKRITWNRYFLGRILLTLNFFRWNTH